MIGHKAHGAVPEIGAIVIARVRFFLLLVFFLVKFIHVNLGVDFSGSCAY